MKVSLLLQVGCPSLHGMLRDYNTQFMFEIYTHIDVCLKYV